MESKTKQRLEQLVRQGIVPSGKLPMLMQAMSSLHMGKQLSPTERKVLDKYMFNMTDIMLKDTTVFNRAKLHTQRTRYQTEETAVEIDENVRVIDGAEEDMEVRGREKAEKKAKRLSIRKRDKYRLLSPELKKEKKKAQMDEEVLELNDTYQEMFEATLEYFEVSNIRDLPEEKKAVFFKIVDEALEEAKMAKKDHDGDGKVETSTSEYMGSRDKAIKKSMKKESFEDNEKRREKARADMAAGKYDKEGNRVKLKGFGPDAGKSNMSNPAARASLMKKEEVEQVQEELPDHLKKLFDKKGNIDPKKVSKEVHGGKKSDAKVTDVTPKGYGPKEEVDNSYVQQVNEYITSKQVRMAKGIANDPRHKGGDYTGAAEKMEKIKKGLSNHPAAKKALRQANEELTPQEKADRMRVIARAADRVQSGAAAKAVEKRAKADMKQKGAQKGMAPTKKDVEEQVQQLRKMIKENNNKAEAYKLLAKILNNAENLGEQ